MEQLDKVTELYYNLVRMGKDTTYSPQIRERAKLIADHMGSRDNLPEEEYEKFSAKYVALLGDEKKAISDEKRSYRVGYFTSGLLEVFTAVSAAASFAEAYRGTDVTHNILNGAFCIAVYFSAKMTSAYTGSRIGCARRSLEKIASEEKLTRKVEANP